MHVGDPVSLEEPGALELDVLGTEVVEETAPLAEDVKVTGAAHWNRRTGAVTANVTLAGAIAGNVHLQWPNDRPGTLAHADGTIDGTKVDGGFLAP